MSREKDTLWYLKRLNLFAGLTKKELAYVESCLVNKRLEKNSVFEIEAENRIYLIKSGLVELSTLLDDGKKVIVDLLEAGSLFGTVPEQKRFYYEARVRETAVICYMPTNDFFELVSRYPQASQRLLRHFYGRLASQQERISSLASESVGERLMRVLQLIMGRENKRVRVNLTQEELAQMVGASRQTVSSMLKQLQRDGVVVKRGGGYEIVGKLTDKEVEES